MNKQGKLYTRLVLGSCRISISLHPPAIIIKAYILVEALKDCSHIHSPGVHNNTLLSQAYILETVPHMGRVGKMYIPRTGEGGEASDCPGPAHGPTEGHVLSMTFFNRSMLLQQQQTNKTKKARKRVRE